MVGGCLIDKHIDDADDVIEDEDGNEVGLEAEGSDDDEAVIQRRSFTRKLSK